MLVLGRRLVSSGFPQKIREDSDGCWLRLIESLTQVERVAPRDSRGLLQGATNSGALRLVVANEEVATARCERLVEMPCHCPCQLSHAEKIRMRPRDEALDGGKVGVARLLLRPLALGQLLIRTQSYGRLSPSGAAAVIGCGRSPPASPSTIRLASQPWAPSRSR